MGSGPSNKCFIGNLSEHLSATFKVLCGNRSHIKPSNPHDGLILQDSALKIPPNIPQTKLRTFGNDRSRHNSDARVEVNVRNKRRANGCESAFRMGKQARSKLRASDEMHDDVVSGVDSQPRAHYVQKSGALSPALTVSA